MQRARKVDSNPIQSRDSLAARARPNPFSSMSGGTAIKKVLSFDELSRRDENATKNFSVPPELIALARANHAGRGHAGTLTPLAPKPTDEVVVVMPSAPAPPIVASFVAPVSDELASVREHAWPAAEPPKSAFDEPFAAEGSGPRVIQASRRAPIASDRYERAPSLRVAAPTIEVDVSPSSEVTPRSAGRSGLRSYAPFLSAGLVVGAYVALCYFANALFASLP